MASLPLLGETVAVMAADDGTGKVHIFDDGLPFAVVILRNRAAENDGEFMGLANGSIGVQQSFPDAIQGRTASKDHVVAILRLRKKQPVINPSRAALTRCKKGISWGSHFRPQRSRSSGLRESASCCRASGSEHCEKALV